MIPGQQQPFKLPRELERRPPRPVRRRAGTLGCGVVVGRFFAVAFLVAALVLLLRIPVLILVVTQGESHPAQVEKTWSSRGRRSTSYHVQYFYEAGGQTHSTSRTVSKSTYDRLSASPTSIPLEVRAMQIGGFWFDQMFVPGEWLWKPVWLGVLIAAIANLIGWAFVYFLWIVPRQHKRLCREGKPVAGHIVKTHSASGKTTTYYLDYEFDHPGLGVRTATLTVESQRWHQAQVGEPVTVLCYPNRKRPTVIYEYGDFECG